MAFNISFQVILLFRCLQDNMFTSIFITLFQAVDVALSITNLKVYIKIYGDRFLRISVSISAFDYCFKLPEQLNVVFLYDLYPYLYLRGVSKNGYYSLTSERPGSPNFINNSIFYNRFCQHKIVQL